MPKPTAISVDFTRLHQHGWTICEGEDSGEAIITVAETLGRCVMQPRRDVKQLLRAKSPSDARENTYSGRFGFGTFPFHTDMANWTTPPRYVLLRHHSGDKSIPTILLDSAFFIDVLGKDCLSNGVWSARGYAGRFLCNVWSLKRRRVLFRWDAFSMRPETELARSTSKRLLDMIQKRQSKNSIAIALGNSGGILVIDNWRMMHSRPKIPSAARSRTLERVLVAESERV
jgi:hypothetical protein